MPSNSALLSKMKMILIQKGQHSQVNARHSILHNFKDNSQISIALRYFSNGALKRCLPVFPAIMSISCEAAGGINQDISAFGEAIVLLTGAADLHDDVIDQSILKGSNETVFGKFGLNVTILAGDILLVEGIVKLNKEAKLIDPKKAEMIIDLVTSAIIEVSKAESEEFKLRAKGFEIKPVDYQKIIWQKAAVPELAMRVGAVLGNGNLETINSLSRFGRTFGYVTTVVDEFTNVLDTDELTNRLKNECPPLPITYLLQNPKSKQTLKLLLKSDFSKEAEHIKLIEMIKKSTDLQKIRKNLVKSINVEVQEMKRFTKGETFDSLETLLTAPLICLDDIYH